jgi:hypothetical protein
MKKRRSYIFTNKKHDLKGIMAVVLGAISLISLVIVLFKTYENAGEAAYSYGFTGLFALIFSVAGLVLGVLSLREKENFLLYAVLGTLINSVVIAFLCFILYVGAKL